MAAGAVKCTAGRRDAVVNLHQPLGVEEAVTLRQAPAHRGSSRGDGAGHVALLEDNPHLERDNRLGGNIKGLRGGVLLEG